MRMRDSEQLKTVLALNDQDIEQKEIPPTYQRLNRRAKKFLHQKIRNRNSEDGNDRTATGTPAKHRDKVDEKSGARKQGDCYQWKAKGKCSKGDACSCRHYMSKRGKDRTSVRPFALRPLHHNHQEAAVEKHFERQNSRKKMSLWKEVPEVVPEAPQGDLQGSIA